ATPILAALPPRKLDVYTFLLGATFVVSAEELTYGTASRRFYPPRPQPQAQTFTSNPQDANDKLPLAAQSDAARQYIASDAAPNDAKEKLLKRQREERGVAGLARKLWYGSEGEGWKERRIREEREALEEGRGYGGLIGDAIRDVVGGSVEREDVERFQEERKREREGKERERGSDLARLANELHHLEEMTKAVKRFALESPLRVNQSTEASLTKTMAQAQKTTQRLQEFLQKYLGQRDAIGVYRRNQGFSGQHRRHSGNINTAIDGDVPPPPQPTQNQSLEVATSVAEMLQQYMALDDSPFQRQYIQTGRELAEIRSQLQRLTRLLIVNNVNLRGWSSKSSPQESDTCDEEHSVGESNSRSSKNRASDATDMFFDCVSRFSEYCTRDGPLDQVRSWLLGSPTSYFESRSTFYGEQYTSESSVGKIATAVAMVELPCTKTHCLQRYSLIYAETARLWRRVTVSVMVPKASQRSAPAKADIRKSESYALEILPWYLYEQLPGLLNGKTLYDTVTEVSLSVEEHATGRHIANTSNVVITEDLEEAGVCDEEIMLREIDHMGCPQYLESEVIVQKLLETNTFLVQVEGQTYIERKMPFSAAALRGENGVIEFYEQLKIAYALRDCEAVVNFVGVVLDDTRTHLKSYLQESPTLGCLGSLFAHAQLEGHWIQWSIRESWAKQIIAAMAKIHGKGFLRWPLLPTSNLGGGR
ncbi:MAG: hypothetical protein L6R39_007116, partial [Caloplaca ligustica]